MAQHSTRFTWPRRGSDWSFHWFCSSLLVLLVFASLTESRNVEYIQGTSLDGVSQLLEVDRQPALFTKDFGDCLGGESLFNITRFDAAFYTDNSTVLFHLDGTTNIRNEALMIHISMEAYGESRFDMTFDPCFVNIYSLCPLNATVPIAAWAFFQIGEAQLGDVPSIAYTIPDFDGTVKIQLFANSSESEIGCFQAVMSNGVTVGYPAAISPVLAVFTLIAIVSSFCTAIYGVSLPHMRSHYAHSLSALVVLETFQSIFLAGALSLDFPLILTAWWSNFAWSAGQIYSSTVVGSLNSFAGLQGNASQAGGAGSSVLNNGGGLASQIYGRSWTDTAVSGLVKRQPYNASDPWDYTWSGDPVGVGLPLPGTSTGFAATLSTLGIPVADAFMLALVWLLAAIGCIILAIALFKASLETMARFKLMQADRLEYFRAHWLSYTLLAVLRTLLGSFFVMVTLALYQLTQHGSTGVTAITALTFVIFTLCLGGCITVAVWSRLRHGKYVRQPDRVNFTRGKILGCLPVIVPSWSSDAKESELARKPVGSVAMSRLQFVDNDPMRPSVHEDNDFITTWGWLTARYRRTKWYFSAVYLPYLLIRSALIGGLLSNPSGQVYGLLVFDLLAFVAFIVLNPFEGQRNTALAVWMLGLVKLVTSALNIAFLPSIGLGRIIQTVVGVIIVIAQGFLVIGLLVLVVLGAISSYMSLTRNREHFKPGALESVRVRYFESMHARRPDAPKPPKPEKPSKRNSKGKGKETKAEPVEPREPYFAVSAVRRAPKIEDDEDDDVIGDLDAPHNNSGMFDPNRIGNRASRAQSIASRRSTHSLSGMGAAPHRVSWSSRDFAEWDALNSHRESNIEGRDTPRRLSMNGSKSLLNLAGGPTTASPVAISADSGGLTLPKRHSTPLHSTPEVHSPTTEVPTPATASDAPTSAPTRVMTPRGDALSKHAAERVHDPPAP